MIEDYFEELKALKNAQAFPGHMMSDSERGLTKREYFAALFMQAQISQGIYSNQGAAQVAVEQADELIKQLLA